MVQREVKKKTSIYAAVAVLSAIVLISTIYVFGAAPIIFPPSQSPNTSGMKTFANMAELKTYLTANSKDQTYAGGPLDDRFFDISPIPSPITPTSQSGSLGINNGAPSQPVPNEYWARPDDQGHSTTNVQVSGVDEADTVKTDGQYIYTVASSGSVGLRWFSYSPSADTQKNTVNIINANPQDAKVVATITLGNNTEVAGLYLSPDDNRLVVLASKYQTYHTASRWEDSGVAPMIMPFYQSDVYTFINVYDVSNKADPVLTQNLTMTGSYFNSRMIGNNVYAVVSQTAYIYHDLVSVPTAYVENKAYEASPSSIYYADMNDTGRSFTSFYGLDVADASVKPTNLTVMMGGASTMYVSPTNIYVTYPQWTSEGQFTSIYRVAINGLDLSFQAEGSVPGSILNQYSMDEYSGDFRIATNWYGESQFSNIYVLNPSLNITGRLEGLAQGENLHSVRFMGDKCYLVTFMKTDPLFAIDLSDPSNPKVIGELKIPGYSDYLHPYDETHLIGVGKEAVDDGQHDFAYYQGVKLALFDVTDMSNPKQLSNYIIGDRGTDSLALSDPKAFLFDKNLGLLVIPASLAIVENKTYASDYGTTVWQGAYVFNVSLDGGFVLKGTITHIDSSLLNSQGQLINSNDYYQTQNEWITRSLYIGNTLYTISNSEVKLNSLSDLSQIGQIKLQ